MIAPSLPLPREKLIVYGLGGAFHWFHEIFMIRQGYRPDYLVDRSVQDGDYHEGIPTCADVAQRIPLQERDQYTVVVCAGKEDTFCSIRAALLGRGFVKVIWLHQLYEIHDPFGLSKDDFAPANAGQHDELIGTARALLEDDRSREIFDCFIETHRTKTPVVIPMSHPDEQYFPDDIGIDISLERIVLCGGGPHDLNRFARKIARPVESLHVFEADPYVFRSIADNTWLSERPSRLRCLAREVTLSPCAVSSTTGIRPFKSASNPAIPRVFPPGFGSRLAADGDSTVQTVALDHVIQGIEPAYICMDIEGEELEALKGARRIIESSRTNFAISVYHKASHIWEIPLLIHSFNSDYSFHLKNYTGFCPETILYAIR